MTKNRKGFALTQIILVIVLVFGLIGTGWYVWQAKGKTNKTLDNTAQGASNATKTSSTVTDFESCKKAGNPIQESYPEVCVSKDGARFINDKAVSLGDKPTPTDDQKISEVIEKYCLDHGSPDAAYAHALILKNQKDQKLYVKDGNFARLSAGCAEGGGFKAFLHKEPSTNWIILGQGQMDTINCSALDGTGIPKTIVSTCFDANGEERAIK